MRVITIILSSSATESNQSLNNMCTSVWLNWLSWFHSTVVILPHIVITITLFGLLIPSNNHIRKTTWHYKWHHSSSGKNKWLKASREIHYRYDSLLRCGSLSCLCCWQRVALTAATHTRGVQVMKLNTVDNINKVRGVSLFPRGRFVCNELQVVRLWEDRRGYRVRAKLREDINATWKGTWVIASCCPFRLVS